MTAIVPFTRIDKNASEAIFVDARTLTAYHAPPRPPHPQAFAEHKVLRDFGKRHPFFRPMLVRILQHKLRPGKDVDTKLCNLTVREGVTMGSALSAALATNMTPISGVDEWIVKFPALKELDDQVVWFRPMMDTVGKRLLGEVQWGVKLRVMMGSTLSVVDMMSDVSPSPEPPPPPTFSTSSPLSDMGGLPLLQGRTWKCLRLCPPGHDPDDHHHADGSGRPSEP